MVPCTRALHKNSNYDLSSNTAMNYRIPSPYCSPRSYSSHRVLSMTLNIIYHRCWPPGHIPLSFGLPIKVLCLQILISDLFSPKRASPLKLFILPQCQPAVFLSVSTWFTADKWAWSASSTPCFCEGDSLPPAQLISHCLPNFCCSKLYQLSLRSILCPLLSHF